MSSAGRLGWRTSSYSNSYDNCVEVAPTADHVALCDSKDRGVGPVVRFSRAQWAAFVREALDGLPSANGAVTVTSVGTETHVHSLTTGDTLRYTAAEWAAFHAGARDGEFDLAELSAPAAR